LRARLRWTDAPTTKLPIEKGTPAIFYDPTESLIYSNAGEEAKVAEVTSIIRSTYPNAFLANFRGDAAVHPMEADLLAQFVPKLAAYAVEYLPVDPERSMILGMHAIAATRDSHQPVIPESETALHEAILADHELFTLQHPAAVFALAYSPDGKLLAVAGSNSFVGICTDKPTRIRPRIC
jgi:hypothetical protein